MSFRILDQNPVYFDSEGQPVAGGELRFYDSGTTTPKAVFADPALTVNNGSTVGLDATGRANVETWGDGNYRVRLYDALGVQIWEKDDVQQSGGAGSSLPALVAGKFLSNDGAVPSWQIILQLPDPTGSAGRFLTNDGTIPTWAQLPTAAQPDIVVTASSFRAGTSANTTKKLVLTGSGSAPASSTKTTQVAVVFGEAFTALEAVTLTPTSGTATSSGALARWAITAKSATGFTVLFSTITGGTSADNFAGSNINAAIPFDYIAVGTKVVA